jgi:hypothetical protein
MVLKLMSSLADKLRAARRVEIKVGEATFFGSRATPEQFSRYASQSSTDAEVCRVHIDDWAGVKESDIIDGGSKDVIKFDRELFGEIIGENPGWYKPIVAELLKDAQERFVKRQDNQKK